MKSYFIQEILTGVLILWALVYLLRRFVLNSKKQGCDSCALNQPTKEPQD